MAEVSFLHLCESLDDFDFDFEFDFEQEETSLFDSVYPHRSHLFCTDSDSITLNDNHIHYAADFFPDPYDQIGFEETLENRENQVTYVMDLIQHRVEQSVSVEIESGVIERYGEEIGGDSLDLELGEVSGLGLEDDDNFGGFIGREINSFSDGLNVVCFESESEDEVTQLLETGLHLHLDDDYASASRNDDESFNLRWNSLNLEDHREVTEDFEWEEVHNGSRNREWEVLLNDVNNLERNPTAEINEDGFIYTADDEVTFAQFAEAEDASMGRPPASSFVIESLPMVTIQESDLQNGNAVCAVCKDEMGVGEQVKQLPCLHRYHGDCITPWLEISNTCPVCRHELPTDDIDYEQRQIERAARDQSRAD